MSDFVLPTIAVLGLCSVLLLMGFIASLRVNKEDKEEEEESDEPIVPPAPPAPIIVQPSPLTIECLKAIREDIDYFLDPPLESDGYWFVIGLHSRIDNLEKRIDAEPYRAAVFAIDKPEDTP